MSSISISTTDDSVLDRPTNVVPHPIGLPVGTPTVVFLIPDSNDVAHVNLWQNSFQELTKIFQVFGVHTRVVPWPISPDSSNCSSFIYVANLAWGYDGVPDRWNAWLDNWPSSIRLINSVQLLKWNTSKTYLKDLEAHGIPIIPTLYVNDINETTLVNAAAHFNATDLIVKPQISAGSRNTLRILVGRDDFASASKSMTIQQAVVQLKQTDVNGSMMIQPFISNILNEGEISVLVFDGKISHAVTKTPRHDDYRVQSRYGGKYTTLEHLSSEIQSLVQATIIACPEKPVYARVDIVRNNATNILSIMELELIEPWLFLEQAPDKGLAFARAVLALEFNK